MKAHAFEMEPGKRGSGGGTPWEVGERKRSELSICHN
jgi:hypothetical protein